MSLLSVQNVSKRVREGERERTILHGVELELQAGELVGIWGARRSGRTTLLRIAAGIETPDAGTVQFEGSDLAKHRDRTLGTGIGYVTRTLRAGEEQRVLEQVGAALLARGTPVDRALESAREALARAGCAGTAAMRVGELAGAELVRVAIARTLTLSPALLVIDDPTATVELSERDGILTLLRELARDGIAVLASSGAPEELAGFHRVLTLGEGVLRGVSASGLAPVVALRSRAV
ncbi:MAG TPA: ATP-binding cassette domain-containing protein [Solirubrobacteraceae bacterium]|nr:ATP-binding cassette domain-containing protein [Solirubrobacteraceae bacterium]